VWQPKQNLFGRVSALGRVFDLISAFGRVATLGSVFDPVLEFGGRVATFGRVFRTL